MPLFSAKLDYALRAVVDLAMQPPSEACQSREIAARQDIRGPYLDQILAILKREGIVRSIRGAGGGYTLSRPPSKISVLEIIRAITGNSLLVNSDAASAHPATGGATYIVREFAQQTERQLCDGLADVSLADLVSRKRDMDDTMSFMPGI